MNWPVLQNSLLVSGATAAISTLIGFLTALWIASLPQSRRRFLVGTLLATLALPPFLVVNTWLDLLKPGGFLHSWCPVNLFTLSGTITILVSMLWPISTLLTLGAWNRIEPAQLENDPALRGHQLIRWLLWPSARGAIGMATVLTFVVALNQFAVPVLLQVPVLPEELWLAFTTRLNDAGAWAAAWPMIVAPVLVLLVFRTSALPWPRLSNSETTTAWRRQLGSGWHAGSAFLALALMLISLGIPLGHLALNRHTWMELPPLLRAAPDVIVNSVLLAGATATLVVAVGSLMVRWKPGGVLWLLFFTPGILLGRVLIPVFSFTPLYGTFAVVLLAFALRYAAVAWQGSVLARQGIDGALVDAGRLEGARGWPLFRHFIWPQIATPSAAVWYVVYLLAFWDVETLVLIYPPGGETLALRIFNLLHYGHHDQVNAMCLTLLGVAVAPLWIWSGVSGLRRWWR